MIGRHPLAITAAVLALAAPAAAGPAPGAELSAILVARTDDGVRVTIRGSGRVVPERVSAVGQLPPRVVVDLPEIAPGTVPARVAGMDQLLDVRVAARANGSTRHARSGRADDLSRARRGGRSRHVDDRPGGGTNRPATG